MYLGTSVSLLKSAISSIARLAIALDEPEAAIDEKEQEKTYRKGWVVVEYCGVIVWLRKVLG
ncbi:hypothetical protein Tco_0834923, partial [Tanacetum coccineum]